ncbi:autotransporter outer membrane beta-barrel domain-containing protein [Escherichia coli]|uniref:autotransporter outer membrane beta-barrel domain-containing protein n=1 Tax=Escherichia coli TaxID=562 RepID=UPI000BE9A93E|nr:S6 family peptidase [Escherichia coli]EER8284751.1 autotransporter outer membrane beta-barrel domain-containing protein [Escherichia coli]EEY3923348.1 autotransporter outer membrane beta-barrel domain-containing protein [Escherichia coli]EEZ7075637.1 autotransporter outer membrane beta-barrel domain-containing protein [Escherichia coli]EFE9559305.1 autotransporter outer membrane beta-barrel domain-containing protein [Escherichia coli]EFF6053108.1 autotransporter outer membrane beta-barrel d
MNKIYSLKYCHITKSLIAVSELARRVTCKSHRRLSRRVILSSVAVLSLSSAWPALAATVSAEIPYQIFRDFAENKGQFTPGSTNISIYDKQGNLVGKLDKAPMADFSSATITTGSLPPGDHTLYSPQYVVTAKHVSGSDTMSFGYTKNTYTAVGTNNNSGLDIKTRRLSKLVTEVAPAEVSDVGAVSGAYQAGGRFTAFYRLGGGMQYVKDKNGNLTQVYSNGGFLTGGTVSALNSYNNGQMITAQTGNIFNPANGPLANYLNMGDSGSPLFAYDSWQKKWVLIGVTSSKTDSGNNWVVTTQDFLGQQPQNDFDKTIAYTSGKGALQWKYDAANGTGTLTQGNTSWDMHGKKGNDLNAGKNLLFTGNNGEVVLQNSVNQGAGYLQFAGDYKVSALNGQTWMGGGIITDKGTHVLWQVNGVAGDNLHKIGEGTLTVNGTGVNAGGLKVGDGTVILNQQADANGKVQAFSSVDIASGRPTVVLSDAQQVNPDNISWGYRGGRLDLNGNNLTFTRLQAADYGAIITNNSEKKSTVTLDLQTLKASDINVPVNTVNILGGKGSPGDLYYDSSTKNYYILKASSYSPFFSDLNNSSVWQNVGKDRNKAIDTVKQQKIEASSQPYMYHGQLNGNMDVNIPQLSGKDILALDGSVNLPEGSITKKSGTLIFQGHPVIHAGTTTSASQSDWETRQFTLGKLKLDAATFHLSRNGQMQGDINATNGSTVILGSDRVFTDKNDGTGNAVSSVEGSATATTAGDQSDYRGNVTLENKSSLKIMEKFTGGIEAYDSSVSVTSQNAVFDRAGSFVNSSLILEKGAKLTAQGGIFSTGAVDVKENASLTLTGTPSAQKQEYYSPVISTTEGINLGDKASLSVKNMGYLSSDIHAGATAATINLGDSDAVGKTDSPLFSSLMKGYNAVLNGSITGEQSTVNMNNALWYSDGNSTIGTLKSAGGRIELGGGKDFTTLKVKELNANNSTFLMHTNNSQADQLNVTNKLSGSNNTVLVDFLNNPASKMNVTLITAPKGSDEKTFTAGTQQIGFSNVTPVISTEKTDDATKWMLTGYQTVADAGASKTATDFMASGYKSFLTEVNNLNKRMGDLRDTQGDAGVWARIMNGTGSADGGYSDNYTHVQIGADRKHELDGVDLFTGALLTYTDSNASSHAFSGKTQSVGGGLYASALFDSGAYFDLIGKYLHHDNEYTASFASLGTKDYSSHSWYAGAEVGYRYHLSEEAWVEPQMELVYGSVSGKSFNWEDRGMALSMKDKDYNPLIGRTGVDVGKSFSGDDWKITARAGLGYQFDLLANGETVLRDASGEKRFEGEKDSRMLMTLGMNAEIKDNMRFGLELEKSAFGKYNVDNAINANFRYSF